MYEILSPILLAYVLPVSNTDLADEQGQAQPGYSVSNVEGREKRFKDTSVHREGDGVREEDFLVPAFVCTFIS